MTDALVDLSLATISLWSARLSLKVAPQMIYCHTQNSLLESGVTIHGL